jgi:hypothetical protein
MAANTADVMRKAMQLAQAQLSKPGTATMGSVTRAVDTSRNMRGASSASPAPQRKK